MKPHTPRQIVLIQTLVWVFRFAAFAFPVQAYLRDRPAGDIIAGAMLGVALWLSAQWTKAQIRRPALAS